MVVTNLAFVIVADLVADLVVIIVADSIIAVDTDHLPFDNHKQVVDSACLEVAVRIHLAWI